MTQIVVTELCTQVLDKCGILPVNSSNTNAVDTTLINKVYNTINQLLDMWSANSFVIPNTQRQIFPFVGNQAIYTYGPGGDWDSANLYIQRMSVQYPSQSSPNQPQEKPLTLMSVKDYQYITAKTVTSSYPDRYYVDNAFPLRTVRVWPVPVAICSAVIYSAQPIYQLQSLNQTLDLPPGYTWMLINNAAASFHVQIGRPVPEQLARDAETSLAQVQRSNQLPEYQYCESSFLQGTNNARFNILTNTFSR